MRSRSGELDLAARCARTGDRQSLAVGGEERQDLHQPEEPVGRCARWDRFDHRPCRFRRGAREDNATAGARQKRGDRIHLGERLGNVRAPRFGEPHDESDVRLALCEPFSRAPRVRQVRPEENQVAVVVIGDIVADVTLAAAVQGQRQLEFRMVVPLEGNAVGKPAIEHRPRRTLRYGHLLEQRSHGPKLAWTDAQFAERTPQDAIPVSFFAPPSQHVGHRKRQKSWANEAGGKQ